MFVYVLLGRVSNGSIHGEGPGGWKVRHILTSATPAWNPNIRMMLLELMRVPRDCVT